VTSPGLFQAQTPASTPPLDDDIKPMREHLQNALDYFKNYQSRQSQVIETLNVNIRQIEQNKADLQQQFEQYKRDKESYIQRLSDAYRDFQRKNESLEKEKSCLSQECDKLRRENSVLQQKNTTSTTIKHNDTTLRESSIVDNKIIAEFNAWSSNPVNPLLPNFKYINGDIKIRSEQVFIDSFGTKWIINRNESKKYLFPNPNLFDEATDISEFYKITGTLKSKGQNKIRIIKPCEIGDKGYINYPGELQII
jgi:hypothetical protein